APVVALALVKREVVHEQDEPLGPIPKLLDDPREVAEILAGDLHEAETARGVLVEERLDGGRLAGATVAVQQDAVGGVAGQELLGVLEHQLALALVADKLMEADRVRRRDADEVAVAARPGAVVADPAEGAVPAERPGPDLCVLLGQRFGQAGPVLGG